MKIRSKIISIIVFVTIMSVFAFPLNSTCANESQEGTGTTPAVLTTIVLSGTIPQLIVGGAGYDLANLTVSGFDQYDNSYDISSLSIDWQAASNDAALLAENTLTPIKEGTGTITATVNGIISNAINFTVLNNSNGFQGGTGTPEDPYLISTPQQLDNVRNYSDSNFKLITDIDLGDYGSFDPIPELQGTFDGNKHTISNLTIYARQHLNSVGLFQTIDQQATVKYLRLKNVYIIGYGFYTGGLAGESYGTIQDICVTGKISGKYNSGGLVGKNHGIIVNSYTMGMSIKGESSAGGLVGWNCGNTDGKAIIEMSYSVAKVSDSEHAGGLVGLDEIGLIMISYYDSTISGLNDTGKGEPLNSADMKRESDVTYEAWKFGDVWKITKEESTYPVLVWEPDSPELEALYFKPYDTYKAELSSNLEIIFNENITADKGNIILKKSSDDSIAETINVSNVAIDHNIVTIDLQNSLETDTEYYVLIDEGCFKDEYGAGYKGISDKNKWSFTTTIYAQGKGTEAEPYEISSADELRNVGFYPGSYFKLAADIDLSSYESFGPLFLDGVFDGDGHTISNVNVQHSDYAALFAYIMENTLIKNIGIENVNINGSGCTGGLAANNYGTIQDVYVTGNIRGYSLAGGLVGINSGIIQNAYSTATVNGENDTNLGGLVGFNEVSSGEIANSYYDSETSGQSDTGKGEPRTTEEMKQQATFAGWDFENTWKMIDGDCPKLMKYEVGIITPAPPAPLNPVADDINNTFGWTNVTGFDNVSDYEYSADNGLTWSDCTANPQEVGNYNYAAGFVQVRVKADRTINRPAGEVLTSDKPYTAIMDPAVLNSIELSGIIPELTVGEEGFDLANLTITGFDQYGNFYDINDLNVSWQIVCGNDSASLAGNILTPVKEGTGTITAIVNDIFSNEIYFTVYNNPATNGFQGGTGTPEDPYLISTPQQLDNVRNYSDSNFKLITDIDLGNYDNFEPIPELQGTFDGNKHTISNLTIYARQSLDSVGLFQTIDQQAAVKYLRLKNVYISGRSFYTGGLAGESYGTIQDICVTGKISGKYNSGGLVGKNHGIITNSYTMGMSIKGESSAGGLVGWNCGNTDGKAIIEMSYSVAKVSDSEHAGGLVGLDEKGLIKISYYDSTISGLNDTGKGEPLNSADMKRESDVTYEAWKFGDVWKITKEESTYPVLVWEPDSPELDALYFKPYDTYKAELSSNLEIIFNENVVANAGNIILKKSSDNSIAETINVSNVAIDHNIVTIDLQNSLETDTEYYVLIDEGCFKDEYGAGYKGISDKDKWSFTTISYAQGKGTKAEPYEISSADELKQIGGYPGSYFKLAADIDLSSYESFGPLFLDGVFDGDGHTISNVNVQHSDYAALFAYILENALIKNIGIENVNINGSGCTGGLAAYNRGTIQDVYVTGNVNGYSAVGGLVAQNFGAIQNAYSTATVSGDDKYDYLGGLVGLNQVNSENIVNSYYDSEISGKNDTGKGEPRTTEEMKRQATFVGWDFENTWKMIDGDCPKLMKYEENITTDPAELTTVTLSGSIPQLTVGQAVYASANLTVSGLDQYGESYDISGLNINWEIASGSEYAKLNGSTLTAVSEGSGTITATVNSITSNPVSFTVKETTAITLEKPLKPVLTLEGKVTWTAVANENNGYRLQLYKDGTPEGNPVEIAHGSALSYDFLSAMSSPGIYTVKITAKGMGKYLNSPQSDPSDPVQVDDNSDQNGQFKLPSDDIELGDEAVIDLGKAVETASDGQINIGGKVENLTQYTGGNLNNQNLTEPKNIGGKTVQIEKAVRLESAAKEQPITITNTDTPDVSAAIPDGTTILASKEWDGTITPPKKVSGIGTAPSGFSIGNTIIEVGSPDTVLLFDKPVILTLKGVTGPVGYKPAGSDTWVRITEQAGGTYDNPTAPAFPGEAYISNGADTKIITYHFTSFAGLKTQDLPDTGRTSHSHHRDNNVTANEPVNNTVILKDIAGHWAEANIKKLVTTGAIKGYADGTFKPDRSISRAEFATVLVKAFKLEAKSGKVFNDTKNHWAKDYIATAEAYGIVNGYDTNTFGPDNLITREQMAVMIVKAAKLEMTAEGRTFKDSSEISDWAKDAVATAAINNIITGYPDNTFRPKANATRAEAVTVILKR